MKITTRFVLLLISSIGIVYVMLQMYSSNYYTNLMEKQLKLESDALTYNIIGQISDLQKDTENVVKTASVGVGIFGPNMEAQIYDYLSGIINNNKNVDGHIYGIGIAFNPEQKPFSPYVSYKNGKITRTNLALTEDYTDSSWYQAAKSTKKPVWTEPYLSRNNEQFFITYAYPIIQNNKLLGVVKADVSLSYLQKYLRDISISNQYIIIIAKNTGTYISHPDHRRIALSGLSPKFPESTRYVINEMMTKNAGSSNFSTQSIKYIINYMTIKDLNWAVGIVFDEKAVKKTVRQIAHNNMVIIIVGLIFILLVICIVAKSITRPLRKLNQQVKEISEGNLSSPILEIKGNDEIAELSRNFFAMQEELKRYIETERQNAAEKERINSQIQLAHNIQDSFLPDKKILKNDKRFSLSSYLKAAQDVGGDLYDFFQLDENTLFIVIGDVADKGIPASLYMSVTMAFARVFGKMSSSLEKIASYINNYLILYNKNNMFVTMMFLIINIQTGEVQLLDAGHGMIKLISGNDNVTTPKTETNIALGIKQDFDFKQTSLTLKQGDILLLYTDGVTDAVNPRGEQFGTARLVEVLRELKPEISAEDNLNTVCEEINYFRKNAPAADDLSMILFEYKG